MLYVLCKHYPARPPPLDCGSSKATLFQLLPRDQAAPQQVIGNENHTQKTLSKSHGMHIDFHQTSGSKAQLRRSRSVKKQKTIKRLGSRPRAVHRWTLFPTLGGLALAVGLRSADIRVETPGGQHNFLFNGTNAGTLTLVRGQTYTFDVDTSSQHPFQIQSPGVVNNEINTGRLTYTVPTNNASYIYVCPIHPWMSGDIFTIPPPEVRILSLELGTDVVLSSTLIPDWKLQAEFATNLYQGEWSVLPIATNRVSSNRVDSICGRPEGDSIFIRLKASR